VCECVFERERERERMCVCVNEREREYSLRKRGRMCVCLRERERVCDCVCNQFSACKKLFYLHARILTGGKF
jgi:hypothetical protein